MTQAIDKAMMGGGEQKSQKPEYVKHADTWHVVDPEGERDPKQRRPHLRAVCGRVTHTGTYADTSIDERPIVCGSAEHRKLAEEQRAELEKAKDLPDLTPAVREAIETELAQLERFCTEP